MREVRVRMAPSPTGYVHLGSVRTALYNYLYAKNHNGSFILRIDDTDTERNLPEYEQAIFSGLRWVGLDWDEGGDKGGEYGPYRQSERFDIYKKATAELLASKNAYHCYCSKEELTLEKETAKAEKRFWKYSRRCLTNPPSNRTESVVRLKLPEGICEFEDMVRGQVRFDYANLADPVLVRRDGAPLYNFASAVDDACMKITDVVRGEEHTSNTPIQIAIWKALDWGMPERFSHLPVINGLDGKKLSKRLHPEARLGLYQEKGYLPEALLNYLVLLGWNPGTTKEKFNLAEMISLFSFQRVHNAPAIMDWKKLNWLNGEYIREMSDEKLGEELLKFSAEFPREIVIRAIPALKERMETLEKGTELLAYLKSPPPTPVMKSGEEVMLRSAIDVLNNIEWNETSIEFALEGLRTEKEWSKSAFYNIIRLCVAGKISPPIAPTLALLPREEVVDRLRGPLGLDATL